MTTEEDVIHLDKEEHKLLTKAIRKHGRNACKKYLGVLAENSNLEDVLETLQEQLFDQEFYQVEDPSTYSRHYKGKLGPLEFSFGISKEPDER